MLEEQIVAEQMRAAWNKATGKIDVSFTPACNATSHTIYHGALEDVADHDWAGAACWQGTDGNAS